MAKHHEKANGVEPTPKPSRKDRSLRSVSPTKLPPPTPESRPKASPKRRLKNKKDKKNSDSVRSKSRALNEHIEEASVADSAAETEEPDDDTIQVAAGLVVDAAAKEAADVVSAIADEVEVDAVAETQTKVTVTSDELDNGDMDATRTTVTVEMPAVAADGSVPESAEEAIKAAKAIVEDAKALQAGEVDGATPVKASRKRKADDLEVENPEEELVTELVKAGEDATSPNGEGASTSTGKKVEFGERSEEPPSKRTRVMVPADDFRRQKMQKRALLGVTATMAVGAIIPFVSNLF